MASCFEDWNVPPNLQNKKYPQYSTVMYVIYGMEYQLLGVGVVEGSLQLGKACKALRGQ